MPHNGEPKPELRRGRSVPQTDPARVFGPECGTKLGPGFGGSPGCSVGGSGGMVDPTEPDRAPLAVQQIAPVSWPHCARAGVEGRTSVAFAVEREGRVRDVERREGVHGYPACEPTACAAVRQWRIEPVIQDGVLAQVGTMVPLAFGMSSLR